jgi:CO/xanthine dehydrogenase Mo-binding subunit
VFINSNSRAGSSRRRYRLTSSAPTVHDASALRLSLAVDTVRFVGEAVAAVIAQTWRAGPDAVDAIDVRYETRRWWSTGGAVAPGAPLVGWRRPEYRRRDTPR